MQNSILFHIHETRLCSHILVNLSITLVITATIVTNALIMNKISANDNDLKVNYEASVELPSASFSISRISDFLQKNGLSLNDEKLARSFLDIGYDNFRSFLLRLNGVITETPIHTRKIHAAENTIATAYGFTAYIAPPGADKEILLKHLYDECCAIKNNEDLGLALYLGIQLIHPFTDGNGRTGRLLWKLLTTPENERQAFLRKDLSAWVEHSNELDSGGRQKINKHVQSPGYCLAVVSTFRSPINFKDINCEGVNYFKGVLTVGICDADKFENPNLSKKLATQLTERLITNHVMFEDKTGVNYADIAFLRLCKENEKLDRYISRPDSETLNIDFKNALPELSAIEATRLLELMRDTQLKQIKKVIECLSRPEEHTFDWGKFSECFMVNK